MSFVGFLRASGTHATHVLACVAMSVDTVDICSAYIYYYLIYSNLQWFKRS